MTPKKGFTLLELLIVIGILAILATATVLVLNPAELLKEARDSQRITDIGSLKNALSLYITSVSAPNMDSSSTPNATCSGGLGTFTCYSDRSASLSAGCNGRYGSAAVATSTSRNIDGTGWLPVNFGNIPGGSPIPNLPTDPANSPSTTYAYACKSDLTYVLTTGFESTKYGPNGDNIAGTDGGPRGNQVYEIGTTPTLALP